MTGISDASQEPPVEATLPDAIGLALLLARLGSADEAIEILQVLQDKGNYGAAVKLANLLAELDRVDRLRVLAEAGSNPAMYKLTDLLAERNRVEELQALAEVRNHWYPAYHLANVMADSGRINEAISILQARSADNIPVVSKKLVKLLVENGRIEHLRALSTSGNQYADAGLIELLINQGDVERVHALAAAGNVYAARRLEGGPAFGDYDVSKRPAPTEIVEWVALAITGGVLGNAAYDYIKSIISRSWRRVHGRKDATVPVSEQEDLAPRAINEGEAFLLSCEAIHIHCEAIGVTSPRFDTLRYDAQQYGDGRWVLMLRDRDGRRFLVRVPPCKTTDTAATVALYLPASMRRRHRYVPKNTASQAFRATN